MATRWSREENELVVADYFDMWSRYLRGEKFTKAVHWRQLQRLLKGRTKGAIEKKHGNISAVLHELGKPSLPGYQPYHNFQDILRELVEAQLGRRPDVTELIARDAERHVVLPREIDALSAIIDETPKPRRDPRRTRAPRTGFFKPKGEVNYLERQARNSALGRAGEELVVEFERQHLISRGRKDLAERVEHVAITQGPSAGFDVRSFDESGRDRLIEVKTTTWGRETPFYVTENERAVSEKQAQQYWLHRLFEFRAEPRLSARRLVLRGPLPVTCDLMPTEYRAVVR